MQIPVQDKLMHTCLLIIGSNPSKARHCLKFPWAVLSQKLSGRKMWLCGKIQMDPSSYMKLPRPEATNQQFNLRLVFLSVGVVSHSRNVNTNDGSLCCISEMKACAGCWIG
ncbi:hypothetical protein M9H77_04161 [Catharanthus roseus]|uniref:Uncharacterized protein n=1 Tax=Catharanthus roseus TaxID=4058 RepID=A0ACC0CDU7_CATRO|nr:hypothetical protein M9H77_04161 [Catharanthus roseus]